MGIKTWFVDNTEQKQGWQVRLNKTLRNGVADGFVVPVKGFFKLEINYKHSLSGKAAKPAAKKSAPKKKAVKKTAKKAKRATKKKARKPKRAAKKAKKAKRSGRKGRR